MERRWILRAAALAALALAGAGAAFAAAGGIADVDTVLHACSRLGDGRLRLVDAGTACHRKEVAVAWNAAGPAGPAGPAGAPGAGLSSLEQLNGLACSGGSGTIAVGYDAAGNAVLACHGSGETGTTGTTGTTTSEGLAAIRVNELSTGTAAAAGDEFVELVNAGTATANIGGFKVVYRAAAGTSDVTLATVPDATTLAPGGRYLLGGSAYAGAAAVDQTFAFGLAAAGGGVGVRDAAGTLLDSVGYGSATNAFVEGAAAPAPPAGDPPGSSLARVPDGHDSGDNASDFAVVAPPTPGSANG